MSLPADHDATVDLIARFREGDQQALEILFARYVPVLRRWTSGRLPRWARDMADTADLVQETVLQAFKNIHRFEHRGEGALIAYLRQAVMNRIRDEFRRAARQPGRSALHPGFAADDTSPQEAAIGSEAAERYEAALSRLPPAEREAIVARVELGLTYQQIAEGQGRISPEAARKAVGRALVRLAEEMRCGTGPGDH